MSLTLPLPDVIPASRQAVRQGEAVVVAHDAGADLVIAAEAATESVVAFMVRHGSGIVQVALTAARLDHLSLPPMVPIHTAEAQRPDAVSVDYRWGTTTGISPSDRTATIRALVDPGATPEDFARPGHVFPLRAEMCGSIGSSGRVEAAINLVTSAGFAPAAALTALMTDGGDPADGPGAAAFAARHGLAVVTAADFGEG